MDTYDIQLPSMEYERRHTVNQRRVIYLAVSGKLFAMFQVAYQRDPTRRPCWKRCTMRGFPSLWTAMISTAMSACWRRLQSARRFGQGADER